MDNAYCYAVFASSLNRNDSYTLLAMISFMNNKTKRVWASTGTLARETRLSYSTVKRSLDSLEEYGVITCVGIQPRNPTDPHGTKIYELNLAVLRGLKRMGSERPYGFREAPSDWGQDDPMGSERPTNSHETAFHQARGFDPAVSVSPLQRNGTVLYGTEPSAQTSSDRSKTQIKTSGTSSPNPNKELRSVDHTGDLLGSPDPSGRSSSNTTCPRPAAPVLISKQDAEILAQIMEYLAYPEEKYEEMVPAFQKYTGPKTAGRLRIHHVVGVRAVQLLEQAGDLEDWSHGW